MKTRSRKVPIRITAAVLLSCSGAQAQHAGDILVGRTSNETGRQLKIAAAVGGFNPGPETNLVVLPPTSPGGFFNGWSSDSPGFDSIVSNDPASDSYVLESGADIHLDVLAIDTSLIIIDTPSFNIIDAPGQSVRLGTHQLHKHVIWLIDADDPDFDETHCIWSLTFRLRDAGSTQYAASPEYTIRFATHIPIPGDFNCDQRVDELDLDILRGCATGPSVPYDPDDLPATCPLVRDSEGIIPADFDRDGDVDADDFAVWQRCYSGEDPGDPACAD
jgi:hypothetical protein